MATTTPAAAPAVPDPLAAPQPIGAGRETEDKANYGSSTPDLRRGSTLSGGGIATGGTGLFMA